MFTYRCDFKPTHGTLFPPGPHKYRRSLHLTLESSVLWVDIQICPMFAKQPAVIVARELAVTVQVDPTSPADEGLEDVEIEDLELAGIGATSAIQF